VRGREFLYMCTHIHVCGVVEPWQTELSFLFLQHLDVRVDG
jgi:hypothetical protein